MSKEKICRECKFFVHDSHCSFYAKRNIVTGELYNLKSCYEMRGLTEMSNLDYDERCGTVGRFYEKLQVTKTTEQQNS